MLTREENILLTSVGAGTPVGELLRRYWHPIAPAAELHGPGRYGLPKSKRLKILGENLGAIDRGIEMFRKMLFEQIEVVKKGGVPIGLIRDRAKNEIIEFQLSTGQARFATAAA